MDAHTHTYIMRMVVDDACHAHMMRRDDGWTIRTNMIMHHDEGASMHI
jgi:hypothetical protein